MGNKPTKKKHSTMHRSITITAACLVAAFAVLVFSPPASASFYPHVISLMAGLGEKKAGKVHRLLKEGRYEEAVEILKDASDRDPFNEELKEYIAQVYRKMGWDYYEDDKLEDGMDAFKRASAYEPEKDADTYLGLGYGSFRMKEFDDALYYLYDAVYLDEENTDGHLMLAQIYYQRGRTDEAIEEWETVLELDPDNEAAKAALAKAEREYEVEGEFSKNETYHFTIKYEGEERSDLGYEVLEILDDAYGDVGGDLNYYPNEPVTVVLYTEQQFTDVTDAPSWSGGLFDGTIRLPVGGHVDMDRLKVVLYHEYTHFVTIMLSGKNIPTWIAEGIAQYEERWVRDMYYLEFDGPVIGLRKLEGSFMGLSGQSAMVAYMESLSAVSFYVDMFGTYSLSQLVKFIGEGMDIDEAFEEASSVSYDDFERYWKESLK